MVGWNILMYCLWEKEDLIGIVRRKMYVWDISLVMFKDRKCLGNKKGWGWESGGFVIKKRGYGF